MEWHISIRKYSVLDRRVSECDWQRKWERATTSQTLILFNKLLIYWYRFLIDVLQIVLIYYRRENCWMSEYGFRMCRQRKVLWDLANPVFGDLSLHWWICNSLVLSGNEGRSYGIWSKITYIIFMFNYIF